MYVYVYFACGFFFAIALMALLMILGQDKLSEGADDVFRVYYFKDDNRSNEFPQCLKTSKYKKEIRGAMAEDVYIWLTGKEK